MPDLVRPVLNATPANGSDPLFQQLLQKRIIFLSSAIDDAVANTVCAQLLLLESDDSEKDIQLYINSPGGSVTAGLAIYDTMQTKKNDVVTFCFGPTPNHGVFL